MTGKMIHCCFDNDDAAVLPGGFWLVCSEVKSLVPSGSVSQKQMVTFPPKNWHMFPEWVSKCVYTLVMRKNLVRTAVHWCSNVLPDFYFLILHQCCG